ncbi:MAG: hypothetical protein P4L87_26045 [Formivibrio sp.]|nr:hypothetical protein [Formivibrio sp.]
MPHEFYALCPADFFCRFMDELGQQFHIECPRVLAKIRVHAKPVFVDGGYDGDLEEQRVKVIKRGCPGVSQYPNESKQEGDLSNAGKGPTQGYDQKGAGDVEENEGRHDMPEPHQRRDVDGAAGKEVSAVAKRGGTGVNGEPFAHEVQVNSLVGQQTALGKFLGRHGHAWDFLGSQLLLDNRIEFSGRKAEPMGGIYPMIPNLAPLVLEAKDEIKHAPQSLALF